MSSFDHQLQRYIVSIGKYKQKEIDRVPKPHQAPHTKSLNNPITSASGLRMTSELFHGLRAQFEIRR